VVGELYHLVALVVVAEDHGLFAQLLASGGDARVHSVIGQREVVVQRAGFAHGCGSVKNQRFFE